MKNEKYSQLISLFTLINLITIVNSYSSGAPPTDEICGSLRPNHPGDPQASEFPYKFQLNKRLVPPSGTVSLTITGSDQPFKGFLVQGRKQNFDKELTPIGSFVTEGREHQLQSIDCLNVENSSVTHRNGDEKRNVTVVWKAPKEKGTYVLLATVVASGRVYWVGHATPTITVQ